MNDNVKELIDEVTTQTIVKLKKSKLIKDSSVSTFKKTEEILKNYNKYKKAVEYDYSDTTKTIKLINVIDSALKTISDDQYYSIIEMFYFEHKTRSEIAEFYDVDEKTISRNKKRLIDDLKIILFSDNTIEEIFM